MPHGARCRHASVCAAMRLRSRDTPSSSRFERGGAGNQLVSKQGLLTGRSAPSSITGQDQGRGIRPQPYILRGSDRNGPLGDLLSSLNLDVSGSGLGIGRCISRDVFDRSFKFDAYAPVLFVDGGAVAASGGSNCVGNDALGLACARRAGASPSTARRAGRMACKLKRAVACRENWSAVRTLHLLHPT